MGTSTFAIVPAAVGMAVMYFGWSMAIWGVSGAVFVVLELCFLARLCLVAVTIKQGMVVVRNLWSTHRFTGVTTVGLTTDYSELSSMYAGYLPLVALSAQGQSKPIRIDAPAYMRHGKRLQLFDKLTDAGMVVPDIMRESRMWRTRQKESWRAALKDLFG